MEWSVGSGVANPRGLFGLTSAVIVVTCRSYTELLDTGRLLLGSR